jgi:hypothetical protein
MNNLLALDAANVGAAFRNVLRNWRYLPFIATFGFFLVLAVAHLVRTRLPELVPIGPALLGAVFGLTITDFVNRRIARLAEDSSFAPCALTRWQAMTYRAAYLILGAIVLGGTVMPAGKQALMWAACGYAVAGPIFGSLIFRFRMANGAANWSASALSNLHATRQNLVPMAAATVATIAAIWIAELFTADDVGAGFGICLLLLYAVIFTPVDHGIINFERLAGHSLLHSVIGHLARPSLGLIAIIGSYALVNEVFFIALSGLIAASVCIFRILQIILFRLYSRRAAEWVLTMTIGMVMLLAMTISFAAPLGLFAILLYLGVRSQRQTWRMS